MSCLGFLPARVIRNLQDVAFDGHARPYHYSHPLSKAQSLGVRVSFPSLIKKNRNSGSPRVRQLGLLSQSFHSPYISLDRVSMVPDLALEPARGEG